MPAVPDQLSHCAGCGEDRPSRGRHERPSRRLVVFVAVVAWLAVLPARAERTDVIVVENGDTITGEIKKLDRGILVYKTDSAGTLNVEWEEVLSIKSVHVFDVETVSGGHFYGSLEPLERDAPSVTVVEEERSTGLFLENIVRISPVKRTFFQRIDGSLSLGFDYTAATDISKLNFAFSADYRSRKFATGFSYNTNFTTQPEVSTTARADSTYYWETFRSNRWFTRWSGNLQSNDEVGLELRTQISWVGGRYLIQTDHSALTGGFGLAMSRESRTGEDENRDNIDLVLTSDAQFFKFKFPKKDFSVSLFVYPSLTTWGRVRGDFDARFRFELVTDFFFEISGWATYDNDPPPEAASDTDYALVSSLSWTF